jgi:drug/metabolite transporter (DMT)-like permease
MNKKQSIFAASIAVLLLLNLGSGILIKLSPGYYGRVAILLVLIGVVAFIYFLRTLMWLFLGRHYQLSFVYPFLGINYVLSLFVGMSVFGEPFVGRRLAGALVILCGVTLLSFSRHREEVRVAPGPVA